MKNLFIVESQGKVDKIQKYLGNDYIVMASFGHLTNLDKKEMGIDYNTNFEPKYQLMDDKKEVLNKLLENKKKCNNVIIATDNDSEGEAIGYHLCKLLNLDTKTNQRIIFNEITENAIKIALKNKTILDMNIVYSQRARQLVDKICGFSLSPILWKHIKKDLSCGRVMSMAVRLVTEKEKKIDVYFFKKISL